jgi:hypothetical protein
VGGRLPTPICALGVSPESIVLYHSITKKIADFDIYYSIELVNNYMQKLFLSISFHVFFLIKRNTV